MGKIKYELIGYIYQQVLRPLLFQIDPETVHDNMTAIGHEIGKYHTTRGITNKILRYDSPRLTQKIKGITFSNPVGLSAGFDKDANLPMILPEVGFGFMEVGSVTLHPYKGNPKPRLYRLPKSKGIVVYYGLKNIGVDKIIQKLKNYSLPSTFPIVMSIAKTNTKKNATDASAVMDYRKSLEKCVRADVGEIYEINISCPNTFGGEPFNTPKRLDMLLRAIKSIEIDKPIFVKMPINLTWKQFDSLLVVIVKHKIDGVVIGNLNKDRSDKSILDEIPESIKGGISGVPTRELSNKLIESTYRKYGKKLIIVGVGGIFSADDAYKKIRLGASLVELITGMIYQGPQLIGQINYELDEMLVRDGLKNIKEAIGVDVK